ncbi:MAG: GNAT family N-acetyltransferase [Bacteroidales bacterium]|nr:GNAT family N-acetyltransferase [Bacteroidales bacterium]
MINPRISIRPVDKKEGIELQKIGKNTFYETFVDTCSPTDMHIYLEEQHALNRLNAELENPESQFFFAERENRIVAYLKVNWGKAQTESKLPKALEIERLYVLAEFQGLKIGQLMMDKAIEIAKAMSRDFVWLGVWENNFKAIRFYEKLGFSVFDSHVFWVGNDPQTDVLMKVYV